MKYSNTFLALPAISACLAVVALFTPSAVFAQSTSFQHIDGKNCPGGFTQSRGMCTSTKGDKEGMVKSGRCPSGFSDTGAYCYREVKADKSSASGGKSSGSVSQPDPSPNQTFAYKNITARVKKANEADQCPTGYFTNRQDISECITHFSDAPKSRLSTGGKCNAGETLERGKYCTSATPLSAQDMDSAVTADSNELYTAYGIKHGKTPTLDSKPPEVAAPALAALHADKAAERAKQEAVNTEATRKAEAEQAALNNQRHEQYRAMCEAARPNFPAGYPPGHTCHGIALSGPSTGTGVGPTATPTAATQAAPTVGAPAKDAAKLEAGKSLRGLFGR